MKNECGAARPFWFTQAFGAEDLTSTAMRNAQAEWRALYYDGERADAAGEEDGCLRLPVALVSKLYKTVFSEYRVTASNGYLKNCLRTLDGVRKQAMQQALIGGECLVKPVPTRDGMRFVVLPRDGFAPLERDVFGRMTAVGTAETLVRGRWFYTFLERRTARENGDLVIESKLYRSDSRQTLGCEVRLSALPEYAALLPVLVLPGVFGLGVAALRTPLPNCVDGSEDAVAVFAPAVGLIHSINRNEWLLAREFELGRSRVIASADLLSAGPGGRRLQDDLFVGLDDGSEAVGITVFSPALREASYLARKQAYLRDIESLIGLKRGILSEVEEAAKTATEITSSAGDYNLTIADFQCAWEMMLQDLLPACLVLGRLYGVRGAKAAGDWKPEMVQVDWGDGVLFDRTRTWAEYCDMVEKGLLRPEIALGWYFSEPSESEADRAKIRAKWMGAADTVVKKREE